MWFPAPVFIRQGTLTSTTGFHSAVAHEFMFQWSHWWSTADFALLWSKPYRNSICITWLLSTNLNTVYVSRDYHQPIRTIYNVATVNQSEHSICIKWLLSTNQNTVYVSRAYYRPTRTSICITWLLSINQNIVYVSHDYCQPIRTQYMYHVTTIDQSEQVYMCHVTIVNQS